MKKGNNDFMGKVKAFFRPSKGKIILFIVLGILSFIWGYFTPYGTFPLLKQGDDTYFYESGLPLPFLYFGCANAVEAGDVITCDSNYKIRIMNLILDLAILYILSSLIIKLYKQLKQKYETA